MCFVFPAPYARQFSSILAGCLILGTMTLAQPAAAAEKNCATSVAAQQQAAEQRIDQQRALSLARAEKDFATRTKGYQAEFNSVYFIHSFDPESCAYRGVDSVNVVHSLKQNGKHVKNVVAHLDPAGSRVSKFSEHEAKFMGTLTQGATTWSGYGVGLKNSAKTSYKSLRYVASGWRVPQIYSPDIGDTNCSPECTLSVWVGLSEVAGGTNGKLAQAGTSSARTCQWTYDMDAGGFGAISFQCENNHAMFYEFYPAPAVGCEGSSYINENDVIGVAVSRNLSNGQLTNTYKVAVYNQTRGKACATTASYAMSNSYFASVIAEAPSFTSGMPATLPRFDTLKIEGTQISDATTTFQLSRMVNTFAPAGQADAIKYLMYMNGTKQNILIGDVQSDSSFLQYYLTSVK
jgi:hypothetical protein